MSENIAANKHVALNFLRNAIDNIDDAMLSVVLHRAQIVHHITRYKAIHKMSLARSDTRKKYIEDLIASSSKLNLNSDFFRKIIDCLFEESAVLYEHGRQAQTDPFLIAVGDNKMEHFNISLYHMDVAFYSLLSERMHLVACVGEYKKKHNMPALAEKRWQSVLETKIKRAEALHINAKSIERLYTLIHEEALDIERAIKNGNACPG